MRILAQAENERGEAELVVACNYLAHRASKSRDHHSYIGTRRDTLRRVRTAEGEDTFLIARRRLELDEFTLMSANVSILL
ncbi:3-phenylpropionate dioxygenase subunit beta [Novosphingobium nitrogenifigens DSM 19370]|uniref:3-phenylpropionate dioxygenase subunit beta n=1 Tax=Novosphingobium nitrogenifigens DSM 19370 TaxID=983920 RepID=F1Z783_9SPHN|nr:3-phenylpropionate dioxygenase subunit beta [Novosphingobium nitrogenifigens DSM 19370]